MAQIPGNELFPDQKRNYGSNTVVSVDIALTDDVDGYGNGVGNSVWFKPGNARAVFWVSALADVIAKMRPDESTTASEWRQMILAGQIAKSTATQVGIISGEVMPHEFLLYSDNSSENAITVYFVY